MNFDQKVYAVVRKIPRGKVLSYGQVALLAGSGRAARAVGFAMRRAPDDVALPCHRVLRQSGELARGANFMEEGGQRGLLEREGVVFTKDGRVDMKRYGWDGR